MPALRVNGSQGIYNEFLTTPSNFNQEFKWTQSEPFFGDLGYSLPLPWPQITTAGYLNGGNTQNMTAGTEVIPPTNRLPSQKQLIMSDKPEWFATNNRIKTLGGLPEIDPNNPVYSYKRSDATQNVGF